MIVPLCSLSLADDSASMSRQEFALCHIAAVYGDDGISGESTGMAWGTGEVGIGDHAYLGPRGVGEWTCGLTFCCLHSLQAFRQPPRRLPVTGGVFSMSTESGVLCMKSTPGGRGILGDRKSVWGIK